MLPACGCCLSSSGVSWIEAEVTYTMSSPGSAEHRAGGLLHGHLHDALDATLRIVSCNAPAAPLRHPHAAVDVDGRAIRIAVGGRDLHEHAPVTDLAGGGIEIPRPDRMPAAVGEVESAIVGAPAQRVRADDAVDHALAGMIAAQAVEAAARRCLGIVHAARPETPL